MSKKISEEKIKKAAPDWQTVFDSIQDPIMLLDSEFNIITINKALVSFLGLPREKILGNSCFTLIHRTNKPFDSCPVMKMMQTKEHEEAEIYLDERGIWLSVSVDPSLDATGYVVGAVHILKDITSRKKAEYVSRINEERYRMAEAIGHVGNWEYNLRTTKFWGSDEAKRIYGFDPEALHFSSDEVENCVPERERVHQALVDLIEADKPYNLEFEIHPKNSLQPRVISSVAKLTRDEHGNPLLVTGVIQDITKRKRAQEELRESEKLFRVILENVLDPVFITDDEGAFTFICSNVQIVLGYAVEEIAAMGNISMLFGKRLFALDELQAQGKIYNLESVIVKKDGSRRDYLVTVKQVSIKDGTILYTCHDITERKSAEDALLLSLNEKEILLKEVHHRTKNNMQVMSGLLDLQASSIGNPELIAMLNESQRRIRAMTLVHEKLLSSKDFARIDLADYVRSLSRELFQAHNIRSGRVDLIIQADSAVYVDINRATPCGLILNELISNVFKHAFPGDEPGKLEIIIRETKNAEIEIVVRDNGLGLPADIDIHQPRSVGLHLVEGLVVNQLGGQIEVRRDAGTEFRIKFPLLFTEMKGATQ